MTLREALYEARLYARVERAEQYVWQLLDGTWSASSFLVTADQLGRIVNVYRVDRDGRATYLKG